MFNRHVQLLYSYKGKMFANFFLKYNETGQNSFC